MPNHDSSIIQWGGKPEQQAMAMELSTEVMELTLKMDLFHRLNLFSSPTRYFNPTSMMYGSCRNMTRSVGKARSRNGGIFVN